MATKPSSLPFWAAKADGTDVDIVDPVSGVNNVVEPSNAQKELGWIRNQFPPRQFFNWLARLTFKWIKFLDDSIDQEVKITSNPTFAGVEVNGGDLNVSASDDLNVLGTGNIEVLKSPTAEIDFLSIMDGATPAVAVQKKIGLDEVLVASPGVYGIHIQSAQVLQLDGDAGLTIETSGGNAVTINPSGDLIFSGLPSVDPGVPGAVYRNGSGQLFVSL